MKAKGKLYRHVLFWLVFIGYELTFIHFTVGSLGKLSNFLVFYSLNILLFYFNAHVVLDFAFFRTRTPYLIAIGLTFIELTLYLFVKYVLDCLMANPSHPISGHIKLNELYAVTNIWRGLYFIGLSIAYWSMLYMIHYKERNHQMETEHLKTIANTLELENKYISVENAYLQNQISPHLLFNSLNFIYNKVYLESEEAGNSVALLSELMRYSLVSTGDSRKVLLSQEVRQMENLIALCQMRFSGQFFLRVKKKGKLTSVHIIPLVLITLVENMMKHGDLGEKKIPALIQLELDESRLTFITRNKIKNTNLYPKNGLGLKNVEKRLGNYYQGRYRMITVSEQEIFKVNLIINL